MPTHQWLITSSYGLVSWKSGIGRGTPLIRMTTTLGPILVVGNFPPPTSMFSNQSWQQLPHCFPKPHVAVISIHFTFTAPPPPQAEREAQEEKTQSCKEIRVMTCSDSSPLCFRCEWLEITMAVMVVNMMLVVLLGISVLNWGKRNWRPWLWIRSVKLTLLQHFGH